MENQINVGIQRQSYEPFKAADSEAENSNADASLADDSTGTHTGGNSNIVAPRLEGESVNPAPPEPVASNNTLHRYSMGDTVIMGRPEYAMPDYNPGGSTSTAQNSLPSENTTVRHDATSWMKEASISGSNDSGGSTDSGDEADYGGGGDYSSGGDVGGGGDGGSGPAGGGVDSGGSADGSNDGTVDQHGSGDFDDGGDSYSEDNVADSANASANSAESSTGDGSRLIGTVPCAATTAQLDTVHVTASRISNDRSANANTGSHGGSLNDYLSADNYGVGSQPNESTNADSTQSTGTSEYQGAVDAASRLLGKPQGTVSYDDVLGTLAQIRGASQNPELTMREQQALNSMFMAVYTRGNTERVIGPTVTNEFLNAAITSLMFGGGNARIPKPNLPTGPMLPGTTGNRTAVTLPSNRASETASLLAAAQQPFRGQTLTNAGRAATKHPEYFGFESTERMRAAYRSDAQINALANQSLQEILSSGVRTTGAGGRYPNGWITYTLPDGRAASWQSSGEFIGFRGMSK